MMIRIFVFLLCVFSYPLIAYTPDVYTTIVSTKDSYDLLALIGAGDKGEVFLARDSKKNFVAIKRMRPREQLRALYPDFYLDTLLASDGSSLIAKREYEIGCKLNHPHILKVIDLFTQQDAKSSVSTYLVLEYIDGKSLYFISGSLSSSQAIQNALDLIDALRHAFLSDFIHNDLHSSNLMIDQNGQIKLIDLDSFDPLPNAEEACEDDTNAEYAKKIQSILFFVLRCGLDDKNHDQMNWAMSELLSAKYAEEGLQPVSVDSVPFFTSYFDDLTQILIKR